MRICCFSQEVIPCSRFIAEFETPFNLSRTALSATKPNAFRKFSIIDPDKANCLSDKPRLYRPCFLIVFGLTLEKLYCIEQKQIFCSCFALFAQIKFQPVQSSQLGHPLPFYLSRKSPGLYRYHWNIKQMNKQCQGLLPAV